LHQVRPPISDVDFQNEVSAYGLTGFVGDITDDWVVEIERATAILICSPCR
jgi:dolichyl-phosphate-mannose-protein mannosyltransferase